jgi:signal transduction histidine kinase
MRFGTRLLLGFATIIAVFFVLMAFNLLSLYATSARIRAIAEREFTAEKAVQDSAQIVLRVKGGVWDALFLDASQRGEAVASLDRDANQFQRNAKLLVDLVPGRKESFERLGSAFRSYFVFAASYLAPGKPFGLRDAPDAVEKFRANQDELMSLIREDSDIVEREFESSLLGLDRSFGAILYVSILGAALAVLVSIVVAVALSRRLTRPIDGLAKVARTVAGGDFAVRATVPESADEVAILASVFNTMLDEMDLYHVGLEAQVSVRTEELARSNESLVAINERLAKAYAELQEAQERLLTSEKRAVIGRLVAGIAHELNTPFAAISSSSRAASEELRTMLPGLPTLYEGASENEIAFCRICAERAQDGIETFDTRDERSRRRAIRASLVAAGAEDSERWAEILTGMGFSSLPPEATELLRTERGERLLEMTARAAAVARAERVVELAVSKAALVVDTLRSYASRDLPRSVAPIELRGELEAALSPLRGSRRRVRIAWSGAPSAWALGDREELGLVWTNILSNAFQAMAGSGELLIDIEAGGPKVSVTIVDDGAGIPEAIRGSVFEPFFTTKSPGEGKGLGLDIARRIVERNGGAIAFRSVPGRTAFTVTLDAAP